MGACAVAPYLCWGHHVLGLGPLRDLGRTVVIIGTTIRGVMFLPSRCRLAIWACVAAHRDVGRERECESVGLVVPSNEMAIQWGGNFPRGCRNS